MSDDKKEMEAKHIIHHLGLSGFRKRMVTEKDGKELSLEFISLWVPILHLEEEVKDAPEGEDRIGYTVDIDVRQLDAIVEMLAKLKDADPFIAKVDLVDVNPDDFEEGEEFEFPTDTPVVS